MLIISETPKLVLIASPNRPFAIERSSSPDVSRNSRNPLDKFAFARRAIEAILHNLWPTSATSRSQAHLVTPSSIYRPECFSMQ